MSAEIVTNVYKYSQQKGTKRLLMIILADKADCAGAVCTTDDSLMQAANLVDDEFEICLGNLVADDELYIYKRENETGVYIVRAGFDHALFEQTLKQVKRIFPLETPLPRIERPGYVYVLRSVTGYYKIGRTKDPDDRLATFEVKLPFEVEYDHLIACGDMVGVERFLHERFANQRVRGEWFELSNDDLEFVKFWNGEL